MNSQSENNARLWSAHFHDSLINILAPRGFRTINDRNREREIADIDFLTKDRIKKAAVTVMDTFRELRENIYKSIEISINNQEELLLKINREIFIERRRFFKWPARLNNLNQQKLLAHNTLDNLKKFRILIETLEPNSNFEIVLLSKDLLQN